jgi:hypothetical protein
MNRDWGETGDFHGTASMQRVMRNEWRKPTIGFLNSELSRGRA